MELFVLLTLLLHVSADVFHEDLSIKACSHSGSDKEDVYILDGEDLCHIDFDRKEAVCPQPDFVDRVTYAGYYEQAVGEQAICQNNLQVFGNALKDLPLRLDPPAVPLVYPRDKLVQGEQNTLVYQASGFYPAPVRFSWTKDQQNVSQTQDSQAFLQSDGTFVQFSRLDLVPEQGQVYSCSVHHPALPPGSSKTRFWTVELQGPSLGPSVFCAVGLTLGLVGVAVGTFFLVKGNECR
uniref:MHC class II alpha chain n=1 Tax=Odontobutis potamophilus TaxID=3358257 RepID=A0A1X9GD48_9GOBI|nr:MHC class II alpha chain [Odontobutis potamophila]